MRRRKQTLIKNNAEDVDIDALMKSCRLCMSVKAKMKKIFDVSDDIDEKILFCTGIKVSKDDNLPSQICLACIRVLQTAHYFKKSSLEADETFRKLIKEKKIKIEIDDEEFDVNDYDDNINKDDDDDDINKNDKKDDDVKKDVKVVDEILDVLKKNNVVVKEVGVKAVESKKEKEEGEVTPTKRIRVGKQSCKPAHLWCSACKLNFDTVDEAKQHNKVAHRGFKVVPAPKRKYQLKKSIRKKKDKKKNVWCRPCNITFDTEEQKQDHRKEKHTEEDFGFICETCGIYFPRRISAWSHIRSHQVPRFACDHCEYRAWSKNDLAKHMFIHIGVKPYLCEWCSKSLRTRSALNAHVNRVHLRLKPHACAACGNTFASLGHLKRHEDSHTHIKRHVCEICQSAFTRRNYWRTHMSDRHGVTIPKTSGGRRKNYIVPDKNAKTELPHVDMEPYIKKAHQVSRTRLTK